jgi:cell wall-associated NlpC family hydrolase
MKTTVIAVGSALILSTTLTSPTLAAPSTAPKKPIPTLAQIAAAKAAEAAQQAAANQAAAKLSTAKATLDTLVQKTIAAQNAYKKALNQLGIATNKFNQAKAAATAAANAVMAANVTLGKLASNAYKMGGGFTTLSSVLSSNGPQDLIDSLSTIKNLGNSDTVALQRFQAASALAKKTQAAALAAQQVQQNATNLVNKTKLAAQQAQSAQQKEVDRLTAVENQIIAQLAKDRTYRLTLEQQRAALLLEEQNSTIAANTSGQSKVWPIRSYMSVGRTSIRSTDAIRASAVDFAKTQVLAHKPYVWGGAGPNSFDCSGLVYAAYHAAGLNYPNWTRLTAALYYGYTQRVSLANLIPGDVLFYSYDGTIQNIHHITIYAGNGMQWEANGTKTGLKYSSIYSIAGLMPFGGRI